MTKASTLIVGGSRGIGAATVHRFLQAGHAVTATHRGSGVPAGATAVEADAIDEQSLSKAVTEAVSSHGSLDTLIFNAGIVHQELVVRMSPESVRKIFEVNTIGAMMAAKHAAKVMSRAGGGSIVLIGSESAQTGIAGSSAYTASKAALVGFMRSFMWEYGQRGIRINVVEPGATETDMLADITPENRTKLINTIPLGRTAEPHEIADVVYWVSQSSYLNGAVIPVTGGEGFGA